MEDIVRILRTWLTQRVVIGLVVGTLAACASTPAPRSPVLDEARASLQAARSSTNVARYAPAELTAASGAFAQAEAAWRRQGDTAETRSLAYLARERAVAAQAAGDRVAAQRDAVTAQAERVRVEREAEEAKAATARADAQAKAAAEEAERAAAARAAPAASAPARSETPAAAARAAPPSSAMARVPKYGNEPFDVVMRDLVAVRSDRGVVVTMGDILFEPGTAALRPGGMRLLARLAALLREHPDRIVAIDGFADNGGDGQALAEARADAARAALVDAGVPAARVVARGYGTAFPVAGNDSAEGRARNRRVEIVIATGRTVPPRVAQASARR